MQKDKRSVDIALIDTGIYEAENLKGKVIDKISFLLSHYEPRGNYATEHGTTCAEIIQSVCTQTRFWDLQILQEDGTTSVQTLSESLEWCIKHKVKLIHLSLGTINYFDIKVLKEPILKLLKQDAIVVAAYHNMNIKSYPAFFPGVFGVRQDRVGILNQSQFIIQKQEGIKAENSLIAHWWEKEEGKHSNSYAAPVITGHIACFLKDNPEAKFGEVLNFLEDQAIKNVSIKDSVQSVFNTKGEIEIPVIAGVDLPCDTMKTLVDWFKTEGYQTVLLQEKTTDYEAIPLEYYGGKSNSLKQILYTVDQIYRSDIIFIDILSNKDYKVIESQEVDICIKYKDNIYQIAMGTVLKTVKTINEISQFIYYQFQ